MLTERQNKVLEKATRYDFSGVELEGKEDVLTIIGQFLDDETEFKKFAEDLGAVSISKRNLEELKKKWEENPELAPTDKFGFKPWEYLPFLEKLLEDAATAAEKDEMYVLVKDKFGASPPEAMQGVSYVHVVGGKGKFKLGNSLVNESEDVTADDESGIRIWCTDSDYAAYNSAMAMFICQTLRQKFGEQGMSTDVYSFRRKDGRLHSQEQQA